MATRPGGRLNDGVRPSQLGHHRAFPRTLRAADINSCRCAAAVSYYRDMSQVPARLARRKKARFLQALATTCNITAACESARLARETAYFWRRTDPDFSAAWDEAIERGLDGLEDEVMRRATVGNER